jgi:hypothetical protein
MRSLWVMLNLGVLLAGCGQPPAALVKQAEATPSATPQDFSAVQPLNPTSDAEMAVAPTPTAIPIPTGALPTPQFQSPEAQAAFENYLERYRQLMMPPPVPATEIIDASQIQSSLETIRQGVLGLRQAEQNLKGILSPNEMRAFRAYQNQLANPPAD